MRTNYIIVAFIIISSVVANAQSLFDKKYVQSTTDEYIKLDSIGNIYLVGESFDASSIIIVKLDTAGNVVWDKMTGIPNAVNEIRDFLILDNKKLILLSTYRSGANFTQSNIICLDTSGSMLYSKLIGDTISGGNLPNGLIADKNGYSVNMNVFYGTKGLELMKFDENGNLIYQRLISGYKYRANLIKKNDDNYLIYSSSLIALNIASVDSSFMNPHEVVSTYPYATSLLFLVFKTIPISDSEFYAVGCFNNRQFFIGHIDKNLKCDWVKKFSFGNYVSPYSLNLLDMQILKDKSWVFIGYEGSMSQSGGEQTHFFLVHTDSIFNSLKAVQLRSGLNVTVSRYNPSFGHTFNNEFFFTSPHVHFDSASNIPRPSPYFEVIKTDSSFSGICITNDTIITTDFDDSTATYANDTYTSDTITTRIDTITLPIIDFIPAYGDCFDTTLSIPNLNKSQEELSIYPNPATNLLHISLNKNIKGGEVNIFNVMGEKVYSDAMSGNEKTINSRLASGVYFVSVIDFGVSAQSNAETRVYTGKVIFYQ